MQPVWFIDFILELEKQMKKYYNKALATCTIVYCIVLF